MDISYLLSAIWRKKWLILILPVVSVVAAYLFTMNLPLVYKSSTQIGTGFTTNEAIKVTDERFNLREADVKFSNLLTTMKSGLLINLLSYRCALHDLNNINKPFRKISTKGGNFFSEQELSLAKQIFLKKLENMEALVVNESNADLLRKVLNSLGYTYPALNGALSINREKNTDYIVISFVSENQNLSAFAVNVFTEEFLRYYAISKMESSGESVSFFERLVDSKKLVLDKKNEELRNIKSNSDFLDLDVQSESKFAQIAVLETLRDEINSNLYGFKLELKDLKASIQGTNSQAQTSPKVTNQRILQLKSKIRDLTDRQTKTGDPVLQDSLTLLRQQYRYELTLVDRNKAIGVDGVDPEVRIREVENSISVEESRLNRTTNKIYSIRGSMSGFASQEAKIRDIEREVDLATDEYRDAVNRFNEARNKLLAATGSVKQIYEASPSANPIPTKRPLIIALAGVSTFMLCILGVVVVELLDTTVKTPVQFQQVVGMPLAGSLPKIDVKKLNFTTLFEKKMDNVNLETFKHFLRKIRFEIESTGAKSFIVTSPKSEEGKTFIVFALSFIFSMVRKKVLIIDTNFKNNTLTKWLAKSIKEKQLLNARQEFGLRILQAGEDPESATESVDPHLIMPTKFPNIFIIGNSGGYESPEEIFQGKNFEDFMATLLNDFDYIFIEGAALNDYSDTKELVKYVDKVIPVFSAGSSIKQLDRDSITYLENLGDKLTGAILNKVEGQNLKM